MRIEYENDEIERALEYYLKGKILSTYNVEYVLRTCFDTAEKCWITDIDIKKDKNVDL